MPLVENHLLELDKLLLSLDRLGLLKMLLLKV